MSDIYDVGQILYVILNKRHQVIPVRVIEQIVKRTIKGEDISYTVELPTGEADTTKTCNLKKLDGDAYTDINDVKNVMKDNALSVIDKIIVKATTVSNNYFKQVLELDDNVGTINDKISVTMDDGTIANVTLPDNIKQIE